MSTFAQTVVEREAPPFTSVVPATIFDPRHPRRPVGDSCVGFVLIQDSEIVTAKANADRIASKLHPNEGDGSIELWAEAYASHLMSWVVAYGTCDPNDVNKRWEYLPLDPDRLTSSLTTDGIRMLFDLYERFRIETDPTQAPLLDAEMDAFVDVLPRLAELEKVDKARGYRARRLLGFVFAELLETE